VLQRLHFAMLPSHNQAMKILIKIISSMATRQLLAELVASYQEIVLCDITIESIGGVDAVKRVHAGEVFDVVVLASDAIDKLIAAGHIDPTSKVDLVNSGVAVAIKSGATVPDISTESALKTAVLAAKTISYSTGPSGVAMVKLFERWGISELIAKRIIQAPPGVPVGDLVATGEVELGFQQLSELIHIQGISVIGFLPTDIQITTTFCAGICKTSTQACAVRELLAFMVSPDAEPAKRRQGMEVI
jgi:molybdate transport system substrate-binding protein